MAGPKPSPTKASPSLSLSLALLAKLVLLVLDGKVATGGLLVLVADVIGDLLVLDLLDGALVALVALAQDMFLYPVDT